MFETLSLYLCKFNTQISTHISTQLYSGITLGCAFAPLAHNICKWRTKNLERGWSRLPEMPSKAKVGIGPTDPKQRKLSFFTNKTTETFSSPDSTADCERSFSSQNLITTKLRCRLSGEHVDALMRVMIEGPTNTEFDCNRALKDLRDRKTRIFFQWLFNNIHVMCICNHVNDELAY